MEPEFLQEWQTQKAALLSQRDGIIAAAEKSRQAAADLTYLIEERKKLIMKLEDASADSALSGVDTAKPIQKRVDELDKLIYSASIAATKAETALSGLNRRLTSISEEISVHDARLPLLWADHLELEGRAEVERYAKLHDELTSSYGRIQAAGIWCSRLRGSRHPRLESIFKNHAPSTEPPRFGNEEGRFDQAEHRELLSTMVDLKKQGVDATLPSGMY